MSEGENDNRDYENNSAIAESEGVSIVEPMKTKVGNEHLYEDCLMYLDVDKMMAEISRI